MPPPRYKIRRLKALNSDVRVEGGAIATPKAPPTWWHLASIPASRKLLSRRLAGPGVLRVTLEVTAGTVGLVLWKKGKSEEQIDTSAVEAGSGRTVVDLSVPDMAEVGQLVVRNDGPEGGPMSLQLIDIEMIAVDLQHAVDAPGVMHAFYDLTIYPHTFDFAYFVMNAEISRQRAGLKSLHVHIIRPGRNEIGRLPKGFHSAIDDAARESRIYNILLPILTLFPTVEGYSVLPRATDAYAMREYLSHVYPADMTPAAGAPIHTDYREANRTLCNVPQAVRPRASWQSHRYVSQWLSTRAKGRKVVTITLRQYEFLPQRNSNLEAWSVFASELDSKGYFVVVVPDTATALDARPPEFANVTMFPEAAFNVPLRVALYEQAYLNLATTGGPPVLMLLSDRVPFLFFKLLVPGVDLCSAEHLADVGFTINEDLGHMGPHQHLVWADDDLATIRREFDAMVRRLEKESARAPNAPAHSANRRQMRDQVH